MEEPVKQAIVPKMGPIRLMAGRMQRNGIPMAMKLLIGWKI